MEPNLNTYKQILLSDKPKAYRPDKKIFKQLSRAFPDVVIFGFGIYYEDYWYILASSDQFPVNEVGKNGSIPIHIVLSWAKPRLILVSR